MVDVDGTPRGTFHNNVLLDSSKYEVKFDNGDTEVVTANIIAETLLLQVDKEGHCQMLLDTIEDHQILLQAIPKSRGHMLPNQELDAKFRLLGVGSYMSNGRMDWVIG